MALLLLTWGCGHPPGTFRLSRARILTPPGVKDSSVAAARIPLPPAYRKKACEPSANGLAVRRGWILASGDALRSMPPDELYTWTTGLEAQGCLPANTAFQFADQIVDSLPLEVGMRRQLAGVRVDLHAGNSLNVVSPVLKPGSNGPGTNEIASVTPGSAPGSIDVEVRSSAAVIGYEVDWYDVLAKDGAPGYRIVPRTAEIHAGGSVQHPDAPSVTRFAFGPDANWYQLNMMTKVSSNDFDFVVFSARTPAGLRDSVAAFQRDATAWLKGADPRTYTVLPHGVGINAFLRVRVNGEGYDLPRGATVAQAIAAAKGVSGSLPSGLKVSKLHSGQLAPLIWDAGDTGVLSLPLDGGEEISWQ